jgi:hypothetical protein
MQISEIGNKIELGDKTTSTPFINEAWGRKSPREGDLAPGVLTQVVQ